MKRREFIALLGGAAVTLPLGARAQQSAMPVIGFMSSRSPEDSAHLLEAFRRGLREGGFIDGENVSRSSSAGRAAITAACQRSPPIS